MLKLNKRKILNYQKNRDPYLMIDFATKVIPGVLAEGYKNLKKNEWFFKVHWPNDPNMPGLLQVESMVQLSSLCILTLPGNKGKTLYLISLDKIRFFQKVIPNDRLVLKTKMTYWKNGLGKFYSESFVKNKLVCKSDFTLVLSEIVQSRK